MISVASRTLKNLKILKTTQNKIFKNGKNLKNLQKNVKFGIYIDDLNAKNRQNIANAGTIFSTMGP